MASFTPDFDEQLGTALLHDPHSVETISILEKCVGLQIEKQMYHSDANFALLKLYKFFPAKRNLEKCEKIFSKALLNLEDFLPSQYLLPHTLQKSEAFVQIQELADALHTAEFETFWGKLKEASSVNSITGFESDARNQIGNMLALAYQVLPYGVAKDALNCGSDADLKKFFAEQKWTISNDASSVEIPLNSENKPKEKKFEEHIQFHQVAPLLKIISK